MARATGTSPAPDDADRDRGLRLLAGVGARRAGGIDDNGLEGGKRAISALGLPSHARNLCFTLTTLTYPLAYPQALHNVVMYATDLALYPDGTEGPADVGTAFTTYTGLNVLIVLLAALLTLWAPSAGRWIERYFWVSRATQLAHCIASRWWVPHFFPSTYLSSAGSSGLPKLKSYLNGTYMRDGMLSASTLMAKVALPTMATLATMVTLSGCITLESSLLVTMAILTLRCWASPSSPVPTCLSAATGRWSTSAPCAPRS